MNESVHLIEEGMVCLEPLIAVPDSLLLAVGFARRVRLSAGRQDLGDDGYYAGK